MEDYVLRYNKAKNNIAKIFVFYFWSVMFFFPTDGISSLFYTIPSLIFSLIFFILFVLEGNRKLNKESYYLLLFILGSILTGIVNGDYQIIVSTFMFTFPIFLVNEKFIKLNYRFISMLFVLTLLLGMIGYHLGYVKYGYLPGHSLLNGMKPWWRVSLFPNSTPTVNAFFFLFIYLYSTDKKTKFSKIARIISIYFIFLSGSRTVILSFLIIQAFRVLPKSSFLRKIMPYLTIIIPLSLMLSSHVISLSDNQFLQEYLFRGRNIESSEDLARVTLWDNLLTIFYEHPIFGLGTYDLYDIFPDSPSFSESKWFTLLSSQGIFTISLFMFFIKKFKKECSENSVLNYGVLTIIPAMFFYGSFYVPYNVIFFLNIFLISYEEPR